MRAQTEHRKWRRRRQRAIIFHSALALRPPPTGGQAEGRPRGRLAGLFAIFANLTAPLPASLVVVVAALVALAASLVRRHRHSKRAGERHAQLDVDPLGARLATESHLSAAARVSPASVPPELLLQVNGIIKKFAAAAAAGDKIRPRRPSGGLKMGRGGEAPAAPFRCGGGPSASGADSTLTNRQVGGGHAGAPSWGRAKRGLGCETKKGDAAAPAAELSRLGSQPSRGPAAAAAAALSMSGRAEGAKKTAKRRKRLRPTTSCIIRCEPASLAPRGRPHASPLRGGGGGLRAAPLKLITPVVQPCLRPEQTKRLEARPGERRVRPCRAHDWPAPPSRAQLGPLERAAHGPALARKPISRLRAMQIDPTSWLQLRRRRRPNFGSALFPSIAVAQCRLEGEGPKRRWRDGEQTKRKLGRLQAAGQWPLFALSYMWPANWSAGPLERTPPPLESVLVAWRHICEQRTWPLACLGRRQRANNVWPVALAGPRAMANSFGQICARPGRSTGTLLAPMDRARRGHCLQAKWKWAQRIASTFNESNAKGAPNLNAEANLEAPARPQLRLWAPFGAHLRPDCLGARLEARLMGAPRLGRACKKRRAHYLHQPTVSGPNCCSPCRRRRRRCSHCSSSSDCSRRAQLHPRRALHLGQSNTKAPQKLPASKWPVDHGGVALVANTPKRPSVAAGRRWPRRGAKLITRGGRGRAGSGPAPPPLSCIVTLALLLACACLARAARPSALSGASVQVVGAAAASSPQQQQQLFGPSELDNNGRQSIIGSADAASLSPPPPMDVRAALWPPSGGGGGQEARAPASPRGPHQARRLTGRRNNNDDTNYNNSLRGAAPVSGGRTLAGRTAALGRKKFPFDKIGGEAAGARFSRRRRRCRHHARLRPGRPAALLAPLFPAAQLDLDSAALGRAQMERHEALLASKRAAPSSGDFLLANHWPRFPGNKSPGREELERPGRQGAGRAPANSARQQNGARGGGRPKDGPRRAWWSLEPSDDVSGFDSGHEFAAPGLLSIGAPHWPAAAAAANTSRARRHLIDQSSAGRKFAAVLVARAPPDELQADTPSGASAAASLRPQAKSLGGARRQLAELQQMHREQARHSQRLQLLATGCPADWCECVWRNGKQVADCSGHSARLDRLPAGLDQLLQVLNVSANNLGELRAQAFSSLALTNLQRVYLSR